MPTSQVVSAWIESFDRFGIIGRPLSTNVMCLDGIGRDSWERVEGSALFLKRIPPKNEGKKPSPNLTLC